MRSHNRNVEAEKWKKLLGYLRRGWTYSAACRQADLVYGTVMKRKREDEDFAAQCQEAYDEGTDTFEDEANRRAFEGTLKPVYQQGGRVGTIREFSDPLAALILKKRNPAFKERHEHSGTGEGGAIIVTVDKRVARI